MLTKSPYIKIAENIDKNQPTSLRTENGFSIAFIQYLQLIYTMDEALLVQYLEATPGIRTAGYVAEMSGKKIEYVENVLAGINNKGGIIHRKGKYSLPAIGLIINLYRIYPEIKGKILWNNHNSILQANCFPRTNEHCIFCGVCVDICPVGAISLNGKTKSAAADPEKCLGCGACAVGCPENALQLHCHEC